MAFTSVVRSLVLFILIVMIALLAIFNATSQKKDGFLELYFVGELPDRLQENKQYDLSFAVRSTMQDEIVSNYRIFSQKGEFGSGSIGLAYNETKIITRVFTTKDLVSESRPSKIRISVELADSGQQIHFWTELI